MKEKLNEQKEKLEEEFQKKDRAFLEEEKEKREVQGRGSLVFSWSWEMLLVVNSNGNNIARLERTQCNPKTSWYPRQ